MWRIRDKLTLEAVKHRDKGLTDLADPRGQTLNKLQEKQKIISFTKQNLPKTEELAAQGT